MVDVQIPSPFAGFNWTACAHALNPCEPRTRSMDAIAWLWPETGPRTMHFEDHHNESSYTFDRHDCIFL